MSTEFKYARFHKNGYEVSSHGDKRFSALYARLKDGRTIEEAYQLDVKGFRDVCNDWRVGKGKKPLYEEVNLWEEYLALWVKWAEENPRLIDELCEKVGISGILTDKFATSDISQARALAHVLNERFR